MAQFPLIDQASLVMIPGAYKESKVYSQLPTDGSGDFTFSRGTDNATRVNEEGLIEKGYENTLLGSNDWARDDSSYTITGGEAGYDGTNDAWLVNKLAAAYFSKDALVLTGVHTISFYAKAGSLDRIFVFIGGEAARFDLTNGTAVSAGGNPVSQNIELVSGTTDWYRCSIVINKNTTQNFLIKPQNSSNQDVTGTIYIQDAQLNQGLVAYPYLETTASPAYGGITDNQPRLDYTDSSCPALLLEPQRTNLVRYSEAIEFGFTANECTITATSENNPSGLPFSYTATAIDSQNDKIRYRFGTTTGKHYFSVFIKGDGTTNRIRIRGLGTTEGADAYWNIYSDGSVIFDANISAQNINPITQNFGNNWYRIGYNVEYNGFQASYIDIVPSNSNLTSSVYLWGLQMEQDATYPTSYIPTYGTSVTRSGDDTEIVDLNTNQIFGQNSGTIFLDIKRAVARDSTEIVWQWKDTNNAIVFRLYYKEAGECSVFTFYNNRDNEFITAQTTIGYSPKIAISYDGTSRLELFGNGSKIAKTGGNFQSNVALDKMQLLNSLWNVTEFKGITFFNTALTDSECIALTTL